MRDQVHIVGGGITGLFLAYHHTKLGDSVTLYEMSDKLGGVIGTKVVNEGLVELAANGVLLTDEMKSMLDDIGLSPVFPNKAAKRRYFWTNQKLSRLPISIFTGIRLVFTLLFKKIKFNENQNFETWACQMFGTSVTKNIIEPAIGGVYGTRLDSLQAESIFSKWEGSGKNTILQELKRNKTKTYGTVSFPKGMGDLVSHLVQYLEHKIQIKTQFQPVNLKEILTWKGKIRFSTSLKNLIPILGDLIEPNEVPNLLSITTITRFGKNHLTKKPCFGVLFGKNEGIRALGVLSNSDIFPGRSQQGLHSETWIYPSIIKPSDSITWESILEEDRKVITEKEDSPKAVYVTSWSGVFPAYDKKLYSFNKRLDSLERQWLSNGIDIRFLGNYRKGIGLRSIFESTSRE
ncbi:FAD-dependent oxidoreductase [Leptospira sp. 2 VSF19]|uniref:FAD-dependent oxidoreductase n=1 Tax=Leptospira soteropolitanensis TaxID=2950025 RepID=A0AAW5VPV1_9LEPT|nr:FAD-dependent oxidoreductase [Leptospira soteropolitanensis]MCW7494493.1 FAD-dependent oxidoreductase [Leptospira soteropolitanensis]MCW7502087.1 FAD-dependent oxidoreductase [Leptospira soteropolitanensis]MCW7524339.1 FAD-dependent oxidoreductase [Leptospira soteropolitanensis]MCW7528204.1 FAD-dependent oxidoreductase [Leptospira soteropolitanensis]MCW7532057.1 FAD-dependent oxidoreductase [Leptospira soteropolitanensis]